MSNRPTQNIAAGIKLRDILPEARPFGSTLDPQYVFESACGKWDECQQNDLFVAIENPESDGHDFAADVIARGASAIVGERLVTTSIPQFIVDDSRVAYGKICHALSGLPSQRMATIGVTGAAGKTVTSHLIYSILRQADLLAGLSSTIETRFEESTCEPQTDNTSPSIAQRLAKMVVGKCTHAVIEASSIPLAQHAFAGTQLDAAVLTNVQRSNLGFHGNFRNYKKATSRLFQYLKPTGVAVINADDKFAEQVVDDVAVPTLTYGIHTRADVTAKILDRNASFQTFLLTAGMESAVVRTTTIGKQHIYNCLAAATVGLTFGIDLNTIAAGLESTKLPGRMERVDCGQEYGVWIDSSLSPSQLNGAIAAVNPICNGRLWCVCSTDISQTPDERKLIGEILERKTEKPIITHSRATKQIDYEPCHQVMDGFKNPAVAHVMPDRIKAIEWVLSQAESEDIVLITGAGEKPIAVMGDKSWNVTDRDVCQAYLSATGTNQRQPISEIYKIDDYR